MGITEPIKRERTTKEQMAYKKVSLKLNNYYHTVLVANIHKFVSVDVISPRFNQTSLASYTDLQLQGLYELNFGVCFLYLADNFLFNAK